MWASKKCLHIFDLITGKRAIRIKKHTGNHLNFYDMGSSVFYSCDAAVYSYLDEWRIKGFKTIVKGEEEAETVAKLPDIPIILDEPKNKIKQSIVKINAPSYKLNLFSQLIGGQLETEANTEA